MKISENILEEARTILSQDGIRLPAQIKCAPLFYVTKELDKSVIALGVIKHDGEFFKVGTMRSSD